MKSILPLLTILLFAAIAVFADDQTRNVQSQLKNQGFYYGDVDGKPSSELAAAIRRYQIRNGLEVTGDLNQQTLGSLGVGGAPANAQPSPQNPPLVERPQPGKEPAPVPQPKSPAPPVNLRRGSNDENNGNSQPAPDEIVRPRPPHIPGIIPPPAPLDDRDPVAPDSGGGSFAHVFVGTPYAVAPRVVQESTVRRAQQILADRGFYRDPISGQPGPGLEEAILSYQRAVRLPLTGRLDLQTLSGLRLLPVGRGPGNAPLKPFNAPDAGAPDPSGAHPIYRGVWVQ